VNVLDNLQILPQMLGMDWMDPNTLLNWFGPGLFWVGLVIIFIECGLFFPFLPGDTLLVAIGLFIATDKVDIIPGPHQVDLIFAIVLFVIAAFAGNVAGYEIGRRLGTRVYARDGRFLKREYLDQTSAFFTKHGSSALVIGRFVPFVRTFITLVAGVTKMRRRHFFVWSLVGAVLWVCAVTLIGYFLGRTFPSLVDNIDYLTLGLLALTVIPLAYEWFKRRHDRAAHAASPSAAGDAAGDAESDAASDDVSATAE
jgi:membrane-associated protein